MATAESKPHLMEGSSSSPSVASDRPRSGHYDESERSTEGPRRHEEFPSSGLDGARDERTGSEGAIHEDPKRPAFTGRALLTLESRISKLKKRVRNQARAGARRNGLVHIDTPHVITAWRECLAIADVVVKRLSWISGVAAGCLFSLIVALFNRETPPSMEVSIGLLIVFSATLVVGWSTTK